MSSADARVANLRAVGRALAEGIAPSDLTLEAGILHALTNGEMGTPAPDDSGRAEAWERAALFVRQEAGRRLADMFAADTGVTFEQVAEALHTTDGGPDTPTGRLVDWLRERDTPERVAVNLAPSAFLRDVVTAIALELYQRAKRAPTEKRLVLRRGIAFQQSLLTTPKHVEQASSGRQLPEHEAEWRRLYTEFEPLGWAERLVMHALVTFARESGALERHPWATASGAMPWRPDMEIPRVTIAYPGTSEVARVCGYQSTASGNVSGATRAKLEDALRQLAKQPRTIAVRVLIPQVRRGRTQWVEDILLQQSTWVDMRELLLTKGKYLSLHPAAVASHLRSFEEIPDLGARYEAAREAMGKRQMHDSWAAGDDYLRFVARSIGAAHESRELPARPGQTISDTGIRKRLAHAKLLEMTGLGAHVKKRGAVAGVRALEDVLEFCRHMGSLLAATRVATANGDMWDCVLPLPDRGTDGDQLVALTPETPK